jgi:transposase
MTFLPWIGINISFWPYDKEMYKARHLMENFCCKLKQYRAIATRYDKTARNFLAGIHLAAAVIWLN